MVVSIRDESIFTLNFFDDRVFLSEDETDFDYMLRILHEEYETWAITINLS